MTLERTQLKFATSARTGEIIGFVSRHSKTKQLRGVREDSPYKKKICVLSEDLKGKVMPNVLYSVELKPMHSGVFRSAARENLLQPDHCRSHRFIAAPYRY